MKLYLLSIYDQIIFIINLLRTYIYYQFILMINLLFDYIYDQLIIKLYLWSID